MNALLRAFLRRAAQMTSLSDMARVSREAGSMLLHQSQRRDRVRAKAAPRLKTMQNDKEVAT